MKVFRQSGLLAVRQSRGTLVSGGSVHFQLVNLWVEKNGFVVGWQGFHALVLLFFALPIFSATPNLQPTRSAISDITMLEDSAIQGIALSGISDGGDSVVQTLTITAVSSNPAIVLNPSVVYTSPAIYRAIHVFWLAVTPGGAG